MASKGGAGSRERASRKLRAKAVAPVACSPAPTPAVAAPGTPGQRTIPEPSDDLDALVRRTTWPATTIVHRFHQDVFGAADFNPGLDGNARFSPIADSAGRSIPTIYGGTTLECAAMETVFHDVPHAPGIKTVAKRKLKGHQHSQFRPAENLTLADLGSTALRKLGIKRVDLLESEKDTYSQTRSWAEAIHAQCSDVQGLTWVSRQDDSARAMVLFEDRLPPNPLRSIAPSLDIVADADTYAKLIALADTIGVKITGK